MDQYINKADLIAEIEKCYNECLKRAKTIDSEYWNAKADAYRNVLVILENTFEVREVDFGKLGEIARHLIAVRDHIEDMRLDKEEWLMLEKIGYPERFKAHKGD
jgi:hypothetical protein